MENFFSRYKNPLVLMIVLFIQVVGLATQVKRSETARAAGSGGGPRLIRVWTVTIITPFEKAFSGSGRFIRRTWHNYIDLHDARKENQALQEQLVRLKMEQTRLQEDAGQAKRLQVLLDFKERYVGQTMPAQVIGTSGADQSRVIYIDKGSRAGIKQDMPVITPDGIVGKVKEVFPFTSQVLLVNDHDSGAGVLLQNSRLQGGLSGTPQGQLVVNRVMSDNKIEPGERVVTSGGDRIYPKGLPVGTVVSSAPDTENDPFLKIIIKPAANLEKLEEVLVITKVVEDAAPAPTTTGTQRAADILAQRLPSAKENVTPTPTPTPAPVSTPKATPAAAGEKKAIVTGTPAAAGEKKTPVAGATPAPPGVTKKSGGGNAVAAPSPTTGTTTAQPGVTQKKSAGGKTAANPSTTNGATPAPSPATTPVAAAGKKKSSSAPGAPKTGGTAAATPGTQSSGSAPAGGATVPGATVNRVTTPGTPLAGTAKKKTAPKPKPTPTPGDAQATPTETPEQTKPEPESTPTPPPPGVM